MKDVLDVKKWLCVEEVGLAFIGVKVGIDLNVYSVSEARGLREVLSVCGIELMSVEENLVDLVWSDCLLFLKMLFRVYLMEYAGKSVAEKLENF